MNGRIIRIATAIALFVLCGTSAALAQFDLGVRTGLSYSSYIQTVNGRTKSGGQVGFNASLLGEIALPNNWSIRPELAFINQGGKYYSRQSGHDMLLYTTNNSYSLLVPIHAAYTFKLSEVNLSLFAGPALDCTLWGKTRTRELDADDGFEQPGPTDESDLRPLDLVFSFGMQVEHRGIFFSIQPTCGSLDRRGTKREGESRVYQNNVHFSVGYYFR